MGHAKRVKAGDKNGIKSKDLAGGKKTVEVDAGPVARVKSKVNKVSSKTKKSEGHGSRSGSVKASPKVSCKARGSSQNTVEHAVFEEDGLTVDMEVHGDEFLSEGDNDWSEAETSENELVIEQNQSSESEQENGAADNQSSQPDSVSLYCLMKNQITVRSSMIETTEAGQDTNTQGIKSRKRGGIHRPRLLMRTPGHALSTLISGLVLGQALEDEESLTDVNVIVLKTRLAV